MRAGQRLDPLSEYQPEAYYHAVKWISGHRTFHVSFIYNKGEWYPALTTVDYAPQLEKL